MGAQSTLWQKVALRDAGPTELDNEGDAIPLDLAVPTIPSMPLSRPMTGQRVLPADQRGPEWQFAPQAVLESGRTRAGLRLASPEPHILGLAAWGLAPYHLTPVTLFDAWNRGRHPVGAPRSVRIHINGPVPSRISPTDLVLHVLADGGPDVLYGSVIEFDGDGVESLPGIFRTELLAQAGLLRPTMVLAPLTEAVLQDASQLGLELGIQLASMGDHRPGDDAVYKELIIVNAQDVRPMGARPDRGEAKPLDTWAGRTVDRVVVGGCVGGSLRALDYVADLAEDSPATVPFQAVAGSHAVHRRAVDTGVAGRLETGGVRLVPPAEVEPPQPGRLTLSMADCMVPGALVMGLPGIVASAAAGRVEVPQ